MPLRTVDVKSPAVGLLDDLGSLLKRSASRAAAAAGRFVEQLQAHRARRTVTVTVGRTR